MYEMRRGIIEFEDVECLPLVPQQQSVYKQGREICMPVVDCKKRALFSKVERPPGLHMEILWCNLDHSRGLVEVPTAHTRLHSSRTLSAFRIRKSSWQSQSPAVAKARFLAFSKLSLGSGTTPIRWSRSKQASTATNST